MSIEHKYYTSAESDSNKDSFFYENFLYGYGAGQDIPIPLFAQFVASGSLPENFHIAVLHEVPHGYITASISGCTYDSGSNTLTIANYSTTTDWAGFTVTGQGIPDSTTISLQNSTGSSLVLSLSNATTSAQSNSNISLHITIYNSPSVAPSPPTIKVKKGVDNNKLYYLDFTAMPNMPFNYSGYIDLFSNNNWTLLKSNIGSFPYYLATNADNLDRFYILSETYYIGTKDTVQFEIGVDDHMFLFYNDSMINGFHLMGPQWNLGTANKHLITVGLTQGAVIHKFNFIFYDRTGNQQIYVKHLNDDGEPIDIDSASWSRFAPSPSTSPSSNPCLKRGTLVRTSIGDIPIESIVKGDRILNQNNEEISVTGIKNNTKKTNKFNLLKKNSLGVNIPCENLIISDNHFISYKGRILLPEKSNVFVKLPLQTIEFYHIETANYIDDWFYANNCLVETFTDGKNKNHLQERYDRLMRCRHLDNIQKCHPVLDAVQRVASVVQRRVASVVQRVPRTPQKQTPLYQPDRNSIYIKTDSGGFRTKSRNSIPVYIKTDSGGFRTSHHSF